MASPLLHLLAAQARAQAQYRASMITDLAGSTVFGLIDVVTIVVLYGVTRTIGGFTFGETFVMAALSTTGFSLADLAVGNVERIRAYVRTGLLDAILVRPLGALTQLVVMDFAPRRAGRLVVGVVMLVVAFQRVDVDWTPGRVVLLVITPLAGAVVFGSVFVATSVVAFWWIESGEFANGFTYGGRDFTSFPMSIYSSAFRWILGYGLGYAFVGYYPALTLLDRPDPLGLPAVTGWLSPLVAVVAVTVTSALWRTGIRHYRGTGS